MRLLYFTLLIGCLAEFAVRSYELSLLYKLYTYVPNYIDSKTKQPYRYVGILNQFSTEKDKLDFLAKALMYQDGQDIKLPNTFDGNAAEYFEQIKKLNRRARYLKMYNSNKIGSMNYKTMTQIGTQLITSSKSFARLSNSDKITELDFLETVNQQIVDGRFKAYLNFLTTPLTDNNSRKLSPKQKNEYELLNKWAIDNINKDVTAQNMVDYCKTKNIPVFQLEYAKSTDIIKSGEQATHAFEISKAIDNVNLVNKIRGVCGG